MSIGSASERRKEAEDQEQKKQTTKEELHHYCQNIDYVIITMSGMTVCF